MKAVFAEPVGIKEFNQALIVELLEKENIEALFYNKAPQNSNELINRIKDAKIITVSQMPLTADLLSNAPKLKLINVAFTGTDHIDKNYCKQNGITVCNAAGYSTQAVAELTIGSVINLYRQLHHMENNLRSGLSRNGFLGFELKGKTFGIIGLGAIGARVAELANAFGCKVIGYNRSKKVIDNVTQVDLNQLLAESDIVSLHVPLNESTKDMIGLTELRHMKQSAILINTARGAIINTSDLAVALNIKMIKGAAIDVYEQEPPLPANHKLLECQNTLLLPHLGFATEEAIEIRNKIIVNNIVKWSTGTPENRVC